jgi:phosphoglucomutase
VFVESGLQGVKRIPFERAQRAATTHRHDFLSAYVSDLGCVLDMDAIRGANLRMGVDLVAPKFTIGARSPSAIV